MLSKDQMWSHNFWTMPPLSCITRRRCPREHDKGTLVLARNNYHKAVALLYHQELKSTFCSALSFSL